MSRPPAPSATHPYHAIGHGLSRHRAARITRLVEIVGHASGPLPAIAKIRAVLARKTPHDDPEGAQFRFDKFKPRPGIVEILALGLRPGFRISIAAHAVIGAGCRRAVAPAPGVRGLAAPGKAQITTPGM